MVIFHSFLYVYQRVQKTNGFLSDFSVRFLPSGDGQCVHRFVSSKGAMDVKCPTCWQTRYHSIPIFIENSDWVSHIPCSWSSYLELIIIL